ncbi:succinylglutamate desuccinylase/aspartoacylase family protein [Paracoccus aestuariivivens]|uniref:Peptidase M14 n=1 Tax=Paracoccus aestuariivivens TaxID=1820333 RepID=A0A6L6J6K8_9RHOB|nr:succinylglutamate desuccinylase/aspartoacylase family protein [Paracoccus aestuariivivens]MTH76785.1 peptidase M14 [Paracoccus aestuariivivens]
MPSPNLSIGERLEYPLPAGADGRVHRITAFRYGSAGKGPKAYLQAGLHADEFPGMFALHLLRPMLETAAREGRINGEILVLPQANPLGLTQHPDGFLYGRKESGSGQNFNRGYADLVNLLPPLSLGPDAAANTALIRLAMRDVLAAHAPSTPLDAMRQRLLLLAHDADLVLDLHADNQALPHIYVGTPLWPDAQDIAAEIGARAVLLAEVSGGNPFDEALSGPWWELARRYPDSPVPNGCLATTIEMGSNDDVDPVLARNQAEALFRILARRGFITGESLPDLPELPCGATQLTAMSQIRSPATGLIVYHAALGDHVIEGQAIATILDPLGDEVTVCAETSGCLFARHSQPYGWPDKFIGKIAGTDEIESRKGLLLTD